MIVSEKWLKFRFLIFVKMLRLFQSAANVNSIHLFTMSCISMGICFYEQYKKSFSIAPLSNHSFLKMRLFESRIYLVESRFALNTQPWFDGNLRSVVTIKNVRKT